MKIYVLMRVLRLVDNEVVSLPVGAFSEKKLAEQRHEEVGARIGKLGGHGHIVIPAQSRGETIAQGTGVTVSQFMNEVGIAAVDTQIAEVDVTESGIVVPKSNIILPH